jgi:hypothetical protein
LQTEYPSAELDQRLQIVDLTARVGLSEGSQRQAGDLFLHARGSDRRAGGI